MKVDQYGRVIFAADDLFDALYRGETIDSLCAAGEEVDQYNNLCRYNDKLDCLIQKTPTLEESVEAYHERRQALWNYPKEYDELDLWAVLAERCRTDDELARLGEERKEYEARNLEPLLRLMMFLVDDFRKRNIVWGVGRGSSVASFVLYLIGIIKINPMKYGLEIGEFLKD